MIELLASMIAIGLAASVAPVRILLVLAILAGPMGSARAWSYVLGYVISLLVAGGAASGLVRRAGGSLDWRFVAVLSVAIGAVFLASAAYFAMRAARGMSSPAHRVVTTNLTMKQAMGLGVLTGAFGPKLLTLLVSGVVVAVAGTPHLPMQGLAILVLVMAASIGVSLPPSIVTLVRVDRAAWILDWTRALLLRHATLTVIAIAALIGFSYVAFGFSRLR